MNSFCHGTVKGVIKVVTHPNQKVISMNVLCTVPRIGSRYEDKVGKYYSEWEYLLGVVCSGALNTNKHFFLRFVNSSRITHLLQF